jgi:hypothetical protein
MIKSVYRGFSFKMVCLHYNNYGSTINEFRFIVRYCCIVDEKELRASLTDSEKIENQWPRGTKENDSSGRKVCVYQSKHFRYTPWRRLGGEDV